MAASIEGPARVPGLSPGYYSRGEGYVFTGCLKHDKDPCGECDSA